MKFRHSTTTIPICYFLFILFWIVLCTNASENTKLIPECDIAITPEYGIKKILKHHILYKIVYEYLTIREILIFRQTCHF